jgi:hypothetical protein
MRIDTIRAQGTPTPGTAAPSPRTAGTPAPRPASRPTWRVMVMALMMLTGAFSVAGLVLPTAANAATMVVDQCNGHAPGPEGATTALKCTVTVVNTISGTSTHSTTTVTRLCTLGPCSTPNGTFTTTSISLVTVVRQCNNSDNDAAHAISCSVTITNNIGRDTPDAQPMISPRVTQCVGSAKGGGGAADCRPSPVTGAMVTQCNGSGNGGGGTVHCTVNPGSKVSRAIPIKVSQCNGTGNVGGSAVTCSASIITNLTRSAAARPAATAKATPTATTTTAPTATPTASQSSEAPLGGVQSGPTTAGPNWEGPLMIGAGLTLTAAIIALLYRRFGGTDLLRRITRRD